MHSCSRVRNGEKIVALSQTVFEIYQKVPLVRCVIRRPAAGTTPALMTPAAKGRITAAA